MIIQVENAVASEDLQRLMMMYDRHAHMPEVKDQTGFPVVYWPQLRDEPYAAGLVPRVLEDCLRRIDQQLRPAEQLYPETVILAAMGAGGHHDRHADNCRQDEGGDWVPNHTPHRDVTAICYLNDEFEGGEIFFERAQLTIKPRRELLLAFPSDGDHLHEVFRCAVGLDTRWPCGLRSSNASHCPLNVVARACRWDRLPPALLQLFAHHNRSVLPFGGGSGVSRGGSKIHSIRHSTWGRSLACTPGVGTINAAVKKTLPGLYASIGYMPSKDRSVVAPERLCVPRPLHLTTQSTAVKPH
jgi:hypothetical protein